MTPGAAAVERFSRDLAALLPPESTLGIAVSGGPDSVALLLLAAAARPGAIEAATVDHRLRPESADEAASVAALCARINVPHHILPLHWPDSPSANLQARARKARYDALTGWAIARQLPVIATAHHADDQAETVLMRLARGAGLSGLVATRAKRGLDDGIELIRPLLGWRKQELAAIVAAAGVAAVDDPTNRDPRHDRTRMRAVLREADWADPMRLAASAAWLAEADAALDWTVARLARDRIERESSALWIDVAELPAELRRRLLLAAFAELGAAVPRGADLARATAVLEAGSAASLSGLKLEPGRRWRLSLAPPRRT